MSNPRREIWTGPEPQALVTDLVALGVWVMRTTIDGTQSVLIPWEAVDALQRDLDARKVEDGGFRDRLRALTERKG